MAAQEAPGPGGADDRLAGLQAVRAVPAGGGRQSDGTGSDRGGLREASGGCCGACGASRRGLRSCRRFSAGLRDKSLAGRPVQSANRPGARTSLWRREEDSGTGPKC